MGYICPEMPLRHDAGGNTLLGPGASQPQQLLGHDGGLSSKGCNTGLSENTLNCLSSGKNA